MTYQQISTNKRVLFFDQIRALMIALVIAVHVFHWHLQVVGLAFAFPLRDLLMLSLALQAVFLRISAILSSCVCCF